MIKFRTEVKLAKRLAGKEHGSAEPAIKTDRDQARVRQRYRKLNREELVGRLPLVEQQYAQLNERWLSLNDHVLEWQLRAEQAESQLRTLGQKSSFADLDKKPGNNTT